MVTQEESVPGYKPLNGEEFKDAVLLRVRNYIDTDLKPKMLKDVKYKLENDYRFKISVVYHNLEFNVKVLFKALYVPENEITIQGEAQIQSWVEELRSVRSQLEEALRSHAETLDRLEQDHHDQVGKLEAQVSQARAYAEKLREELKKREREPVDSQFVSPASRQAEPQLFGTPAQHALGEAESVQFEATIEQPVIAEPDRLREELAKSEEYWAVGLSPEEIASTDSTGAPAPPPVPANRGAVVGGKQRPSNVVGKPK